VPARRGAKPPARRARKSEVGAGGRSPTPAQRGPASAPEALNGAPRAAHAADQHASNERGHVMIDLYTWPTPNGHKVHIMLEECGLPYAVHAVDIGAGEQFDPQFLKISPNNKFPAIVDSEGPDGKPMSLFESGAILVYLAGKTGKFLPKTTRGRYEMLQWLMFQMGGLGPMLGQAHHFRNYAPQRI